MILVHARLRRLLRVVCALVLGGCAYGGPGHTGPGYTDAPETGRAYAEPPLPPIREGTIARLVVDGPNAFINGQRVQTGSYVVDGDTVTTGPATSAKLKLNDGGEIQLDQNTDPLFTQGACLIMKIFRGRAALRNLKCQEFEDRFQMKGVARSFIHIESGEDASRVTVLAGEVDIRSPGQATLGADAQYVAGRDGTGRIVQLTPQETAATVAWLRNYFRPRPGTQGTGVSGAEAGALGGVAGALIDLLTRDRKHPRVQQPRPPAGTGRQPDAAPLPGRNDEVVPPRGGQQPPVN